MVLFKATMASYRRLYAFLSQIFDYGSTAIEGRYIFYKHLITSLDFGRERDVIDLSKVKLTHHKLKNKGTSDLSVSGDADKLKPMTDTGTASVQDKEKALLAEIVNKMNDLFSGEFSDNDYIAFATAISGKLKEDQTLVQQAKNNEEGQFGSSPTLRSSTESAVMDALATHTEMSKQVLSSSEKLNGLIAALMGAGQLYQSLRA